MYLSFYNLKKKPFQINTDPSFLLLGEKHKEALATLEKGILDNDRFILLTGDVGTGKTTLVNALISSLGPEFIVARVPDPGMEKIDFVNFLSHALGMGKEFVSNDSFRAHFEQFLNTASTGRKKVLIIFDESQRLSPELLEEVRQLSNIERDVAALLKIFLVGQNELNDILRDSRNTALTQRITRSYILEPLGLQATGDLIHHRLKVAGAEKKIFTPSAIRAVYEQTKGYPRRINILCDHCLISGFLNGEENIHAKTVHAAAADLTLPVLNKQLELKQDQTPERGVDTETLQEKTPERSAGSYFDSMSGNLQALAAAMLAMFGIWYAYTSHHDGGLVHPTKQDGRDLVNTIRGNSEAKSGTREQLSQDSASTTPVLLPHQTLITTKGGATRVSDGKAAGTPAQFESNERARTVSAGSIPDKHSQSSVPSTSMRSDSKSEQDEAAVEREQGTGAGAAKESTQLEASVDVQPYTGVTAEAEQSKITEPAIEEPVIEAVASEDDPAEQITIVEHDTEIKVAEGEFREAVADEVPFDLLTGTETLPTQSFDPETGPETQEPSGAVHLESERHDETVVSVNDEVLSEPVDIEKEDNLTEQVAEDSREDEFAEVSAGAEKIASPVAEQVAEVENAAAELTGPPGTYQVSVESEIIEQRAAVDIEVSLPADETVTASEAEGAAMPERTASRLLDVPEDNNSSEAVTSVKDGDDLPENVEESQNVSPDLFSNMDKYLSEKTPKGKRAKTTVPPKSESKPIDSGKVIDWVIKKRSE